MIEKELEDNNCSHVFHTIKEEIDQWSETYYYFCENCKQERKEVFDIENNEICETEILKEGTKVK